MTCATSCDRRAGPARIIHFPEGATCSPHKRIMSVTGPAEAGPADWGGADWQVLRRELAAIARLAGELRLWTVLGSVHPLTPPHRPWSPTTAATTAAPSSGAGRLLPWQGEPGA
jgi:predicted amidohydrolase